MVIYSSVRGIDFVFFYDFDIDFVIVPTVRYCFVFLFIINYFAGGSTSFFTHGAYFVIGKTCN